MAGTNALIDGGLPELSYALDTCARCGFCKTVCPTHPFGGGFEPWSPRAKVHYLKELREGREELTPEWVDRIYQCTSCERCAEVCQTDIPLVHVWEAARAAAVKAGFGPMPAHKKLRVLVEQHRNPYGEPPAERGRWMLEHHRPGREGRPAGVRRLHRLLPDAAHAPDRGDHPAAPGDPVRLRGRRGGLLRQPLPAHRPAGDGRAADGTQHRCCSTSSG